MKKQIFANLGSSIALFALNVIVGIWMVPYLIRHVGIGGYGMIPLATSLTGYMTLMTFSINGAVSRYLTIDLQHGDVVAANRTFNTALFGLFGVVLLLIPLMSVVSFFSSVLFDVPLGREREASLLFAGVMISFLIATLGANFGVSSFALNRLDLRNLIEFCNILARVLVTVGLFYFLSPGLGSVGAGYAAGAALSFLAGVLVWKKLTPQLEISFRHFDRLQLSSLTSMGGWLIVNQVGSLLFLNIDLILVNRLFGAVLGGEYSSILQWSTLFRSMAGTMAGVLTPLVMIHFANNRLEDVIEVSRRGVRFMGLGLALPLGLICGLSKPLLTLWLGADFARLAPLVWLQLGHLIINLSVLPLFAINTTLNKVRVPGLVSLYSGVGNLILALVFPLLLGWGMYGVAAAGAIMLTAKNALFTPWYCAKILKIPGNSFLGSVCYGIALFLFSSGTSYIASQFLNLGTWTMFVSFCCVFGFLYLALTWICVLTASERSMFLRSVPLTPVN